MRCARGKLRALFAVVQLRFIERCHRQAMNNLRVWRSYFSPNDLYGSGQVAEALEYGMVGVNNLV